MIHLRMSGQLLLAAGAAAAPAHTHVVHARSTARAGELWFVDPRTFGEVVVFDPDNVAVEVPELAELGHRPDRRSVRAWRRWRRSCARAPQR